jgi:hypothetical protein
LEQILARLLAEMNVIEERPDASLREMKAEVSTSREEMRTDQSEMTARLEAKIEDNNEMFEALLGTLVSRMDIHETRTEASQQEKITKMDA